MAQPNSEGSDDKPTSKLEQCTKGTLLFCGQWQFDMIGRKNVPKAVAARGGNEEGEHILAPTRMHFDGIPQDTKFKAVFSGNAAAHAVLVSEGGVAYGLGRNDNGQLGSDVLVSHPHPIELAIPSKGKVVYASCGRTHTVVLLDNGEAYSAGMNHLGQLGIGSVVKGKDTLVNEYPKFQKVLIDEKIVCVSTGAEFSVFVSESGGLYCCGSAQYGQTGLGLTGESIAKSNRITFGVSPKPKKVKGFGSGDGEIKLVECASGLNHSIALTDDGKVYSWGWGGYGRLGHREPKDEYRPRLVEELIGPQYGMDGISCGQQCSFAFKKDRGMLYMWGQPRGVREANMYPKSVYDLQGWPVRAMGQGMSSTVIATESSVISYGGAPCFGELGYGEGQKSSTQPKKIVAVEGLHVFALCEGASLTFLIAREESEAEKEIIQRLDVRDIPINPEREPTSLDAPEPAAATTGTKRGRKPAAKPAKGKVTKKAKK
ncbi:hypothetical protein SARC_06897 [Sphaeroforma arctica JP610]|uniref:RCC1-like domain-containing protein n=1 Tax=Sphaeroforma arctica JP610 TaxID=667725 RepID=A0A0L0FXR2_9EUKA|nr:hypothetical protein SARC_06897 [Sphaeroforma arctica JP610]KNC80753.1 hypothetical protein SARC_06897 [Sphaeroforma arctica JP610]|eukprot:XP_014154655.1 hypothetical protein SARC_06897 [Sphaeroforma arctica JP610]